MSDEFENLFQNHWNNLVDYLQYNENEFETQTKSHFLAYYNKLEDVIVIIPESSKLARFLSKEEYQRVFINGKKLPDIEQYSSRYYNDDEITKNSSYIFSFMKQFGS